MIQVYADNAQVWDATYNRYLPTDNVLIYDSRLEDYDLVKLTVTTGLNVGGTAEIVMPSGHPAYENFVSHKTIVRIYRDGVLRFRGRALYAADNFLGQRTITCEGELCLLRDSINRPYLYQASPRSIFVTLINAHNAQTDVNKRFTVGDVTVVDANDYVRMESESAETILDTLNKAVERVGGYLTFTDAEDGSRVINWLANLDSRSGQTIELGENLLDFSRTGANTTNLITGLVPYGAKDETTKKRVTIESVNGGKDYILATDAISLRGTIMGTATWDDVTQPANLLKKAQDYLAQSKLFITSLDLTALDLSYMDKQIDRFTVGDMIRVVSAPHGVNEDFQLTQMTEDLLNPAQSRITLGKDIPTLTGADVAGDRKGQEGLNAVRVEAGGVDLAGYVTRDDLNGYATNDQLAGYVVKEDLNSYATKGDLTGYATQGDLNSYATKGDLSKYATQEELEMAETRIADQEEMLTDEGGVTVLGEDGKMIRIRGSVVNLHSPDRVKVHSRLHVTGNVIDLDNGQGLRIYNNNGNVYYIVRVDESNNTFIGTDTNNLYLRGPAVYLKSSGAVVTSDRRAKHSIEELPDAYVEALDKMTPVRFKYKDGTSDRYHVGFIAQDVQAALTDAGLCGKDFAGFVDLDKNGKTLGLAYDEFVGLLFQKIRKLEKRLKVLEEKT